MINGIKSQVDKLWTELWTELWTGGITNPLMVIEQIFFLMFARLLDIRETREEKKAKRKGTPFRRIFGDNEQDLRWSHFKNVTPAEAMLVLLRDKVFPHFKRVAVDGAKFGEYMSTGRSSTRAPKPSGHCVLSGDIIESWMSRDGLYHEERTSYFGKHCIACFIVKDGRRVARSDGFVVNIQ